MGLNPDGGWETLTHAKTGAYRVKLLSPVVFRAKLLFPKLPVQFQHHGARENVIVHATKDRLEMVPRSSIRVWR